MTTEMKNALIQEYTILYNTAVRYEDYWKADYYLRLKRELEEEEE